MPPTKYDQFIVSEPFSARCKQNHGEGHERSYVSITCPYCRIKFVEVTHNAIGKLKSTKCKAHLGMCVQYNGGTVPELNKKKQPSNADLLYQVRAMQDKLERNEAIAEERHQATLASIARANGLPPPDPTSEHDLNTRITARFNKALKKERKRSNPFLQLANDEASIKHFRVLLHPDKNAALPETAVRVREALLQQLLNATKHTR